MRNHGVSFETACEVFEAPFLQIVDNELREVLIGMTSIWRLLYVVSVIRLINPRPITNAERKSAETQN